MGSGKKPAQRARPNMKQNEITPLLIVSVPFLASILALVFTIFLYLKVKAADAHDPGDENAKQVQISATIKSGAMAFLRTEYIWLAPFVLAMSIFFFVEEWLVHTADGPGPQGWRMIICFIIGAILSALSGWGGMMVATECNVKTAQA